MLCIVLGVAQIVLATVHAIKESWVTFALILPLVYITYLACKHYASVYKTALTTLPLTVVTEEDAEAAGRGKKGALVVTARKVIARTYAALLKVFDVAYIQPELVHPEIADAQRVQAIIHRGSSDYAATTDAYVGGSFEAAMDSSSVE